MIYIDDRTGSREVSPYIARGIKHQLCRLDFADFAFIGNGPDGMSSAAFVGIERKRLSDFLQSMESGRLTGHQLLGMANNYNYLYVVVEGIWREGHAGILEVPKGAGKWAPLKLGSRQYMVSTLDNFANSLALQLNVKMVFTPSLERTGSWLSNTYKWWTVKRWEQHKSCQKKRMTTMPVPLNGDKQPLVARVLVEFSGVGPDRALKIAKKVNSVRELCGLNVKDLCTIPGIGRGIAEKIVEEINGGPPTKCTWCGYEHYGGPENCKGED